MNPDPLSLGSSTIKTLPIRATEGRDWGELKDVTTEILTSCDL